MANIYGPILPLQLDSRNTDAMVRALQTKIFLESGGTLNDFTPASPLAAIAEGQAFAQASPACSVSFITLILGVHFNSWIQVLCIGKIAQPDMSIFFSNNKNKKKLEKEKTNFIVFFWSR